MPVVFAQPTPFDANLIASYGRSQLQDQFRQQQNASNEALQQRITQASIASAQNMTSANNSNNAIEAQMIQQDRQIDFQRQAQLRQFQAERQAQQEAIAAREREQMNQFAYAGQMVSQQERQQMMRMQDGLSQAKQAWSEGTLNDREYQDAVMELKTGINFTQRRLQNEQAENQKSQAAIRDQEAVALKKSIALGQAFDLDMAERGFNIRRLTDANGKQHVVAVDDKGKFYNPFLEHASKGNDGGEPDFSFRKALPEIRAQAEAIYPGKENEAARNKHIADAFASQGPQRFRVMSPGPPDAQGVREGSIRMEGRTPSQPMPVRMPQTQQQQPQAEQVMPEAKQVAAAANALMSEVMPKLQGDDYAIQAAQESYNKIKEIMSSPKPYLRRDEYVAAVNSLKEILSQVRKK